MSIITPNVFTLYQYTNRLNGKRYIGVTNDPARRAMEHARGHGWSGSIFHVAIKKYGIEVFDYKVLGVFDDAGVAAYHEQAAILKFGTLSPGGYNLRAGAPGTAYSGSQTDLSRAKISASHKGRQKSPEHLAKIGAAIKASPAHKAAMASPEVKERLRACAIGKRYHLGFKHNAETRAKMSAARKKRIITLATRKKMSDAMMGNKYALGCKQTAKSIAKRVKANTGQKRTPETRAKMSAAAKARVARKARKE
jgi:group I intron endonuclease